MADNSTHHSEPTESALPHGEAGETHGTNHDGIAANHDGATVHVEHGATEHTGTEHLAQEATAGHGAAEHHGLELGRHVSHPPEPPHLIQIWFQKEQQSLIHDYAALHGGEEPVSVENWLEKDANGEWQTIDGQKPTVAQALHYGTETKPLPLIGYMPWENHVYMALAAIILVGIFMVLTASFRRDRRVAVRRPSRSQAAIEIVVGGFDDFCKGILGDTHGRTYMPFIGTLFCLILVANLMGLVPLLKAPTSYVLVTFSLALCSFFVVQATAWTRLGPLSYIHHLMGSPKDAIGWCMAPLFLVLEVISDFLAKPLSLALRLFGNILGKDILLGSFMTMGISLVALLPGHLGDYFGVPLTVPFILLGLLLSTIQALVFALLTAIYISLVLPHDHDHGEGLHHDEEFEVYDKHRTGNAGIVEDDPLHEALPS